MYAHTVQQFFIGGSVGQQLQKATTLDGADRLTVLGRTVAHQYALQWQEGGGRNVDLESRYPELSDLFRDLRCDAEMGRTWAQ